MRAAYFLGIDFGTSGARAIALDGNRAICTRARCPFPESRPDARAWQQVLWTLLAELPAPVRAHTVAIAIDGTSGTVVLCNETGEPLEPPIYYDDKRAAACAETIATVAPPGHVTGSATSSLAKLLWWQQQGALDRAHYFLHQADWLGFLLHGNLGYSDYHNALKLGCDPATIAYPEWLLGLLGRPQLLPRVGVPGRTIGPATAAVAREFGFPPDCQVRAGTTDSIAAFLASGASTPGEAVTSLGSTLAIKLLSDRRVDESRYGIYSHRLGDLWLAGGASNTGGAVLRHFFSDDELADLSDRIDPSRDSPLDYYPLLAPGERFPNCDPELQPRLTPRPASPGEFLHGLLASMARIEAEGYRRLQALGATPLTRAYTAGGGAKNATWERIRARQLGVPVSASLQVEAAYGAALLARGDRL